MGRTGTAALALAAIFATTAIGGCIGGPSPAGGDLGADDWREGATWDTTGNYSSPLDVAGHAVLDAERIVVESFDGTEIEAAVWRPDVPDDETVPVILDVGPYYGGGILDLSSREEAFFLDGFVRDGYAYGRVAVRGTAQSGGCQGMFSMDEQRDIDEAVTAFGEAEWSNGKVALYGASYDGTTPWIAASFGNEHLATIVPVSGLTDVGELLFRNGTSETRGPIIQSLYYSFGAAPMVSGYEMRQDHLTDNLCEEAVRGWEASAYTTATGHREPVVASDYWEVRDWRQRVADNYDGSVYLVHGLQDWNVESTMAFPFVNELRDQGVEVKMMLGQWGHDWPDRAEREDHVRWDWAELLQRWFDRELKGEDVAVGPAVDVENNRDNWRTEQTWPPEDRDRTTYHLDRFDLSTEPTEAGQITLVDPASISPEDVRAQGTVVGNSREVGTLYQVSMEVTEELRFAGMARVHVTVVPHTPRGGNLYAQLVDVAPDGTRQRVAHGVMNLQYHDGRRDPAALTPGGPIVAEMEMFPADVVVPSGHDLVLEIHPDSDHMGFASSGHAAPITIQWGDDRSVLGLPEIVRDVGDGTYPGQPTDKG